MRAGNGASGNTCSAPHVFIKTHRVSIGVSQQREEKQKMNRPIRVLIAKPGLDGHDRGALIIAQALRDEGMEVIYTGLRQSPAQIVATAIQEDVDVVGLSCLSGAHKELFPEVVRLLKEQGAGDILVVGGGVIPQEDIPFLKEHGIKAIFTPGTSTKEVAEYIRRAVAERMAQG
jgi:methylmalonyl-CoA mutase, C-terminal domain